MEGVGGGGGGGGGGVCSICIYKHLLPVIAWKCNIVLGVKGEGAHYIPNLPNGQKPFSKSKQSSDQLCWKSMQQLKQWCESVNK